MLMPITAPVALLFFLSPRHCFNYFKRRLQTEQISLLNEVLSLRGRLNTAIYHVRLLRDCVHYSIAPKYLQQRVHKLKLYDSISIEKVLLQGDHNKARAYLQSIRSKFVSSYQRSRTHLNTFDFLRFSWLISECDCTQRSRREKRHTGIILALRRDRFGTCSDNFETIINLSDIPLTQLQKDVLCGGMDFGIPPRFRKTDILAEFELLQQQLSSIPSNSDIAAGSCRASLAAESFRFDNRLRTLDHSCYHGNT